MHSEKVPTMTTSLLAAQRAHARFARAAEPEHPAASARAAEPEHPAAPARAAHPAHPASPARQAWAFEVEGMARRYRASVEKLLLLLPDGPEGEVWFTRWRRGVDGTYSCSERVVATEAELARFERELARLADGKFVARLTRRAYHGAHV